MNCRRGDVVLVLFPDRYRRNLPKFRPVWWKVLARVFEAEGFRCFGDLIAFTLRGAGKG